MARITLYFHSLIGHGGAEKQIILLANSLTDTAHEVSLLSFDDKNSKSFFEISEKVKWFKIEDSYTPLLTKLKRLIAITIFFKLNQIDIMIGFVVAGDRSVLMSAKLNGVKIIAAERNSPYHYSMKENLSINRIWKNLGKADLITVQFAAFKGGYPKNLVDRLRITPNSIRLPSHISKVEKPNDRMFQVLAVQRLDPVQKRTNILIEAFSLIASDFPEWKLTVVGDGIEKKDLDARIQQLGLEDRISLIGSSKSLDTLFLTSNLFVTSTRWEGFSNSLAEAMSFGLPCIGFKSAPGVEELVSDGGWLVPTDGSIDCFALTMAEAMQSHAERAKRGRRARSIIKNYSHQKCYAAWHSCLDEITLNGK